MTVVELVPFRFALPNAVQPTALVCGATDSNPGFTSKFACAALTVNATIMNMAPKRQMFVTVCFSIPRNLPSACMIDIPKSLLLLRYLHTVELVSGGKNAICVAITRSIGADVRPCGAVIARLR